jgi:hypothetical protein
LNSSDSNKQSILLHPVVSIGVILLFTWLAIIHVQMFLENGHYRHLLFIIAAMIIIINRFLWLPKIAISIESKSAYKNIRQSLPLVAVVFVGAYFVL